MRITDHPILEEQENTKVTIFYGDRPIEAHLGEPIASALMAAGIRVMRTTPKFREARGIFCAIGRCTDCMMIVDGIANIRTCVTPVRDGMRVEQQEGLATLAPVEPLGCEKEQDKHA